jgi:hypothetical protein
VAAQAEGTCDTIERGPDGARDACGSTLPIK